jgi:hypothetical protein
MQTKDPLNGTMHIPGICIQDLHTTNLQEKTADSVSLLLMGAGDSSTPYVNWRIKTYFGWENITVRNSNTVL